MGSDFHPRCCSFLVQCIPSRFGYVATPLATDVQRGKHDRIVMLFGYIRASRQESSITCPRRGTVVDCSVPTNGHVPSLLSAHSGLYH